MTNTRYATHPVFWVLLMDPVRRITDVEIMERRYPVILHRFGLREGSAGDGQHHGGEGVIREVEVCLASGTVWIVLKAALSVSGRYAGVYPV